MSLGVSRCIAVSLCVAVPLYLFVSPSISPYLLFATYVMCPAASARFTYKMNTSDVGREDGWQHMIHTGEKMDGQRERKRREKRRDAGKKETGGD